MKLVMKKLMDKLKKRHKAALAVVGFSVYITPGCVKAAEAIRGCKAYGGEYLLVVIGLIVAVAVLEAARELDEYKARRGIAMAGKENAPAAVMKPGASAEHENLLTS